MRISDAFFWYMLGTSWAWQSFERSSTLASVKWREVKYRAQASGQLQRKILLQSDATKSLVLLVTDFGADPTGQNDSTAALQMAIEEAFNTSSSIGLMPGIPDLGGVEIHLEGGNYVISKPLKFPDRGGGNLLFHGGTIRATSSFPSDGYLITLQSRTSKSYPFENIMFKDLMLDGNMRGGGLRLSNCLRTSIENVYISHFTSDGILVEAGHETMISNSFLGQVITAGGDPRERNYAGVGINLGSNDNVISNVVVFSAAIGIIIRGQANLLEGIHLYNKATGFGGVGIQVELPGLTQTRIVACYLDFTAIIADAPSGLVICDCFFLGDANIVLRSSNPSHSLNSVSIVNNLFSGSSHTKAIVEIDGEFNSINNIVVDDNKADGMQLKATRVRASLQGNLSNWKLDLSSRLLFPNSIQNVQYSFIFPKQDLFPKHAIRSIINNTVIIQTDDIVFGTVSVVVDQSSDSLVIESI